MPKLSWSQAILAGAVFTPLTAWQYEYVPAGGAIAILHRATAIDVVVTVTTGSDTLQERSPVSAGGTAGLIPSKFDVPELVDEVAAGDRIKISYENTSAGTITVDGEIDYMPV